MKELSPAGVAVISQVGLEADKREGYDYNKGNGTGVRRLEA